MHIVVSMRTWYGKYLVRSRCMAVGDFSPEMRPNRAVQKEAYWIIKGKIRDKVTRIWKKLKT